MQGGEHIFPGVSNSNYVEFQAGLSKQFGPAKVGVSLAYSPKQNNIGSEDNIYLGASVELPVKDTPVTLNAAAGIEDGAFGDNKIDWSLGASYTINRFELGLTYTDSARTFGTPDSGSRAVFGLKVTF